MKLLDTIQQYHNRGKNVFTSPFILGKLSKFTNWRKHNASIVMSAADSPSRGQR